MLRVQLGCERRFTIEFYDADSRFCHCLRHVISRASTPLTFLLLHTFREVCSRDMISRDIAHVT